MKKHSNLQHRCLEFSQFVQSILAMNSSYERQLSSLRKAIDVKLEDIRDLQKFVVKTDTLEKESKHKDEEIHALKV